MQGGKIRNTVSFQMVRMAKAHRGSIADAFDGLGLHVGQEMVLLLLWEHDGQRQRQLRDQLAIEPPTVTRMLQRMERAGLVRREADPADTRVSRVYLTDRGRAMQGDVEQRWLEVERRTMDGISPVKRMIFRQILDQIHLNLTESE